MKKCITLRFESRILSLLICVSTVLVCIHRGQTFVYSLYACLVAAISSILFYPGERSDGKVPHIWQSLHFCIHSIMLVLGIPMLWLMSFDIMLPMIYSAAGIVLRYVDMDAMFDSFSVWREIEEAARMLFVLLLLFLVFIVEAGGTNHSLLSAMLLCFSYIYLYVCNYLNHSPILTMAQERAIRNAIAESERLIFNKDHDSEKMGALYERICAYMEREKPFLKADFCLDDLAREVITNRSYLSHTINSMAKKGFPQFVNYYRIQYCLKVIDGNPHFKVKELALKCGFRNSTSFSLAFELVVKDTPGSYCHSVISSRLRGGPSSPKV